ncbi:MAG: hypothetical protein MUP81_00230 [Dehalococcoidia bacterium]|nr:hypothetical protein [Dehalococcoidia bacterium]
MSTKYEYCDDTGEVVTSWVALDNWRGITFQPAIAHTIISVKLFLQKIGSPTWGLIVEIRACDVNHKPTGDILCSGYLLASNWAASPGSLVEVTLGVGAPLEASPTEYFIQCRPDSDDANNYLQWIGQYTAPTYTRGTFAYSQNGGTTWTVCSYGCGFEEWGTVGGIASDTIQYIWKVRKTISDTSQLVWKVRKTVSGTSQYIWKVRKAISNTSRYIWNVLSNVSVSDTVQLIWNVGEAVSDEIKAVWNVLFGVAVFDTIQLVWKVRKSISDTAKLIWNLGGFIGKAIKFIWNVYVIAVAPPGTYQIEVHDSLGNLIAILDKAYKISLEETINAPTSLTFSAPADDSKLAYITRARELWVRDVKNNVVLAKLRLLRDDDTR